MSTQVTYESDHISLLRDLRLVKYTKFYCNLKVKYHIRRKIDSKKGVYVKSVLLF